MKQPEGQPPAPRVTAALEDDLRRAVAGDVRFDPATRAVYATDASNFRQPPIGVVIPRTVEDVVATHEVCARHGAPILPRGCGTSLAGNAVNNAVVIDCSRHLDVIGPVDPRRRRVRAQPGAINDAVNAAAAAHGLRFGPDPATHAYCTIGGNIGNNACGAHSLQARLEGDGARTSDNVATLDVLTYDGLRLEVGPTSEADFVAIIAAGGRRARIYQDLRALAQRHGDAIRAGFPRIPRRVSGYNLDDLLPERGFNVAAALAGTEGTCVTVLGATLKLIPRPPARSLLALGYPDIFSAANHVGEILSSRPLCCEAFDATLFADGAEIRGAGLPEGGAWVLVEFGGDTRAGSDARARDLAALLRRLPAPPQGVALFESAGMERRVWQVRESGLARAASWAGRDHWPGWEDSAVAPEGMGAYLRDLQRLYDRHGYHGCFYGHLGDGCIHSRIDFDLSGPPGVARYRAFLEEAADLVVSHGGSLSGEHGDGRQRGALLGRMFGPELLRAFGEFKAIWDPDGRMNPGKVVDPDPLDTDLRLAAPGRNPATTTPSGPRPLPLLFSYPEGRGDLTRAALRCVGVGACRTPSPQGVMCPSFQATREERHSTRGRARLLVEMAQGDLVTRGWRSPAVKEALDLCLACKGCTSECPAQVDMPTYKAEFLHRYHRGRLRPRQAYALGLIDQTARLASWAPGLANALTSRAPFDRLLKTAAGISPSRPIPRLAPVTLQAWFRARGPRNPGGRRVILWPDTFTNYFDTAVGMAAVRAIEAAGWQVSMPAGHVCCGRPLYDHGMLSLARRYLLRSLAALRPLGEPDVPVVGLEPSCVATFRHELPRLLPDNADAGSLSGRVLHLGELFERYDLGVEVRSGLSSVALWTHCHQRATGGDGADRRLLRALGAAVTDLPGTCCGLAGSWGYEPAHHDLSLTLGELSVFPAARASAGPGGMTIVANGFSCRSQIGFVGGRALHLAQLLAPEPPSP